ncbi:MAG: YwqG family protein [Pseudomonadota bacterium]
MALIFILVVTAIVVLLFIRPTLLRESADPKLRPVTLEEIEQGFSRLSDEKLPLVRMHSTNEPSQALDCAIGGPIWAPDEKTTWPEDEDRNPFIHLAQINFAGFDTPRDFPDKGLLQIFVKASEVTGPGGNDTGHSLHIRWYETPQAGTRLSPPQGQSKTLKTVFATELARKSGVRLIPEPRDLPAYPFAWPFSHEVAGPLTTRRPVDDATAERQQRLYSEFDDIVNAHGAHWIGGYPGFAIEDVRGQRPNLRSLNRVLFHAGFDKHICVGDAGAINVLISSSDLNAKRFDRAYLVIEG